MPSATHAGEAVLARFPQLTVTVWGDLVADEFISGEIARVSREAPVLILKHLERAVAPGGGANAAANLAALGVRVRLVGVLGDDASGRALRRDFERRGLGTQGVLTRRGRPTPTKSRILAHHAHTAPQQVVRLDHEPAPLAAAVQQRLAARAQRAAAGSAALLLSDYGYGSVSPELARTVCAKLRSEVVVSVDARYQLGEYRGMRAATPNEAELEAATGVSIGNDRERLQAAGRRFRARLGCAHLLVTRGRDGMALFEAGRAMRPLEVFGSDRALDVTGAGDTVIAVFTAALAAGADAWLAARMANCAGGLVVMKPGTATLKPSELRQALRSAGA